VKFLTASAMVAYHCLIVFDFRDIPIAWTERHFALGEIFARQPAAGL
jgi:hypothetical protein